MKINIDLIYPIGSIYITTKNVSPEVLFGGTWQKFSKGRCLIGEGVVEDNTDNWCGQTKAGDWTAYAGNTGGEVVHTLATNEMPSHGHGWTGVNDWASMSDSTGSYPFRIYQDRKTNWTGTTSNINSTGGSEAHNNMPPYVVVYMWERIG